MQCWTRARAFNVIRPASELSRDLVHEACDVAGWYTKHTCWSYAAALHCSQITLHAELPCDAVI